MHNFVNVSKFVNLKINKYTYTFKPNFSFNFFNSSNDKFDNSKKNKKGKWLTYQI